ncbi:MAG: MATE family efflux transporter [Clostridia bacterium]|nr:MATE family efflux transporter [Clostridia bacterium]
MDIPAKENKMGVLPVGKLLFSMSVPMMLSMLMQAFYNIVDSVFVSQISETGNELSALTFAFPLQSLMIAFGGGTMLGMNTLISKSLGRKDAESADKAAGTGLFLTFCTALVFAFIGIFLARPFFSVQTEVQEIIDLGTVYTSICLGGSIGIFCQFCFERMLQSTGRTVLSTVTQFTGALINIVLDPIFIFEKGDLLFEGAFTMPFGLGLGVAGAAAATIAGQMIAALMGLIFNIFFNHDIHLRIKNIRPHIPAVKEIYKVGLPSIIMQSVGSLTTFTLNQILRSGFTELAVNVYGIYFKLQSFIFMPVFGLNNGMIPIISYNYGAKQPSRVKKTIKISIITAVSIMAAGYAVFLLAPEVLLSLFNPTENMLIMGKSCLRLIGLSFIPAGFCIITISVTQAIGNPFFSLITSACRQLVVLLPVAWLLSLTGNLGAVWLAFPIAEVVSLALSIVFLIRTMKSANKEMSV